MKFPVELFRYFHFWKNIILPIKSLTQFCSFILLIHCNVTLASEPDTFRVKLAKISEDTARINEMIAYARKILYTDPSKAINYCNEAMELSKKNRFSYGLANAYRLAGAYNNDIAGDFTKAEKYFTQALVIYNSKVEQRFKEGKGATLHSFGALYQRSGNYLKAIEYYMEATGTLDSLNNKTILPRTYNNLSSLYSFIKLFDKAEYYARSSLEIAHENNDVQIISVAGVTLSDALMQQGKYNEVLTILKISDSISAKRGDHYIQLLTNYNYGTYYGYYKKDYITSLRYALAAYKEAVVLSNPFELARTSINLSEHYSLNGNHKEALKYLNIAMEYSKAVNSNDLNQRVNYTLGNIYHKLGNYKGASEHLDIAAQLKDSVILEENRRQINFLEALYQKEKKEKEIAMLQTQQQINSLTIKQRNNIIAALMVTLLLLGIIAWITARNIYHKKTVTEKELELQKQRINEIEKQRQLDATLSVLQGEEAERTRLARDLHDGLGGLLSGVKLSLTNMKGNVVLDPESVEQFNSALGLLDSSIRELRRVAHNMMPQALVKFGMSDALSDFCSNVGNSKGVSINYQSFGSKVRIDSNIEINVYRIGQELINNAIKHAIATEMLVQLVQEENRIHLTVQDNGRGFDMNLLKTSKGTGMANIRSRVESQNGHFEIFSAPDMGTEASVEFRWNN